MNTPFAIAKVIATGSSRPGWARATVMLSPLADARGDLLEDWPGTVFKWLKDCGWRLNLNLNPAGTPIQSTPAVIAVADAYAAKAAWAGQAPGPWLDELWHEAFKIALEEPTEAAKLAAAKTCKPPPCNQAPRRYATSTWSDLSRMLQASNAGESLNASKNLRDKNVPASTPPAPNQVTPNHGVAAPPPPPDGSKIAVEAVLPLRQSDLAVLLEIQRAMELSSTTCLAHGDVAGYVATETACCAQARTCGAADSSSPVDPVLHDDIALRTQAKLQFEKAQIAVNASVSQHCSAPKAQDAGQDAANSVPPPIAGIDPANAAKADRATIERQLHDPLDSHEEGNKLQALPTDGTPTCTTDADVANIASQRFFAIQGSPALSRLFGLTIDVEFPQSCITAACKADKSPPPAVGSEFFGWLSMSFPTATPWPTSSATPAAAASAAPASSAASAAPAAPPVPPPDVHTLFKYRIEPDSGIHFWPAPRTEQQACKVDPSQYDGIMVVGGDVALAAATGQVAMTVKRFSLTSLDVKTAAEGAVDRRCHINKSQYWNDVDQKFEGAETDVCLANMPSKWARKTHQTAGLVLLDRGRQQQAVGQLAARDVYQPPTDSGSSRPAVTLLDAEDLTIGYRLDVAVPLKSGAREWRTLMARRIEHGKSGLHCDKVAKVLPILLAPPDSTSHSAHPSPEAVAWRQTIEDAVLGMPVRVVPTGAAPGGDDRHSVDTYVEEAIAIWNGEPMGAHCAGSRDGKVATFDLGVGDLIGLPTSAHEPERRLPLLRYGWPYRVGLRAVYAGAISVPLPKARSTYDAAHAENVHGKLTVPPQNAERPAAWRRFLRHERVDAPYLLLPHDVAMTRHGSMGYERAAHAIVRDAYAGEDAERAKPRSTSRIFVVPNTEIHFAAYHGVFDKVASAKPPQGLAGIDFSAPNGGFPFVTSRVIRGKNGEVFETDRHVSTECTKTGDLVFQPGHERAEDRAKPYYPDPFATFFAIGVRHAGTGKYLEGGPCLLPIYSKERGYPHARPLTLDIERAGVRKHNVLRPQLTDVLRFPDPSDASVSMAAPHAVLMLAPGDDFEVDVWCIPDWKGLAGSSSLIEAVGVMFVQQLSSGTSPEERRAAMEKVLPKPVCDRFESQMAKCRLDKENAACGWRSGLGGLPTPSQDMIAAIALAIHETLACRPLNEIAAVRTLRATHATDRPRLMPMFRSVDSTRCDRDSPVRALRVHRLLHVPPATIAAAAAAAPASGASAVAASASAASQPASAASAAAPPASAASAAGGAKLPCRATVVPPQPNAAPANQDGTQTAPLEYTLTGDLLVDIATTWGVEIRARTSFPTSTAFDDAFRGRSTRDRRDGVWPEVSGRKLETRDVFGFAVDVDGSVSLPSSEVILLRVDELPAPSVVAAPLLSDGRVALSLDVLALPDSPTPMGVIKSRHVFPDRKARLLELTVLARPRHETLMRTSNAPAHDGQWLRPGKPLPAPEPTDADLTMAVWLPAGVRPSEPVCRSPIPAFVWNQGRLGAGAGTRRLVRRSVVRIPMSRGWFSSGADERLGIVVWPPTLFRHATTPLASEQVFTSAAHPDELMNLDQFEDDDLGPGGRFVTRWGDDPIRPQHVAGAPTTKNTFIPPTAFVDLDPTKRLGFEAEVVEMVDMPVHVGRQPRPAGASTADDSAPAEASLKVSLVTYQPRFDVENEQWYVDLTVEHPDEAEPFLRLGLVRYQPHAAPELQVSYPITQWTQLVPTREVEVSVQSSKSTKSVSATITGLRPRFQEPILEPSPVEMPAQHNMQVSVLREYFNEAGLRCQQVKCTKAVEPLPADQATAATPCAVWQYVSAEFEINPKLDTTQRASYCVYVEESERRLPASYVDEPVRPAVARGIGDGASALKSGPRFMARVSL